MSAVQPRRMVPAYLVTGGRRRPDRAALDRLTVLHSADAEPPADLDPEHRSLWALLRDGALTLVEASAHLRLPVSAVNFLATDLVDAGLLSARAPVPRAQQIDRALVERLLVGLRTLR